jgi:hypothetical protein
VSDSKSIKLDINADGNLLLSGSEMTNKPVIQSIIDGVFQDLLINPNGGNVSINTEDSEGYQLNVNGTVKTKDITINGGTHKNVLATNPTDGSFTLNGQPLGARIYKIDELLSGTFSSEDVSNSVNAYVGKNLLQRVTAIETTGSQPVFNGVGFVKVNGSVISYDNSTYSLSDHTHNQINGVLIGDTIWDGSWRKIIANGYNLAIQSGDGSHALQIGYNGSFQYDNQTIWHNGNFTPSSKLDYRTFGSVVDYNINGTGNNGTPWNTIPLIKSDGVMEIGKYIDFHTTVNDTSDYTGRLQVDGTYSLKFNGQEVYTGWNFNPANYLLLAGGTLTGAITATQFRASYVGETFVCNQTDGNAYSMRINNSGGSLYVGVENSSGSYFGSPAYNSVIYSPNNNITIKTPTANFTGNINVNGMLANHYISIKNTIDNDSDGNPWYGLGQKTDSLVNLNGYFGIRLKTNSGNVLIDSSGGITSTGNINAVVFNGNGAGVFNVNASYLGGKPYSDFIYYINRMHSDDSTSSDQLGSYQTFDYNTSGSGVYGGLISFGGLNGSYGTQLIGHYGSGNTLKFRTHNGDAGSWGTWKELYHTGNLTPSDYLLKTGGLMTGAIDMGSHILYADTLYHNNGRIILHGNLHIDSFNGYAIYNQYYSHNEILNFGHTRNNGYDITGVGSMTANGFFTLGALTEKLSMGSSSFGMNREVNTGVIYDGTKGAFQIQHNDKSLNFETYNGANQFNFSGDITVGTTEIPRTLLINNVCGYGGTGTLNINPWGGSVLVSGGNGVIHSGNISNQSVEHSNISAGSNRMNYIDINNTSANQVEFYQSSLNNSYNDNPTGSWCTMFKMSHGDGNTYYNRRLAFPFWGNDVYVGGRTGGSETGWEKLIHSKTIGSFWTGTKVEFDALSKDANTMYIII